MVQPGRDQGERRPGRPEPGRERGTSCSDFPRLPATVDTSKFTVGENLAVTPGSVVLRTDVFELIQYTPQTETVREVPLLFAPPTINKFYVLDLAPGRSMIEWLVGQGQQVFSDLVAQSRRRTGSLRPGHVLRRGARGARRDRRHHGPAGRASRGALFGRDHHRRRPVGHLAARGALGDFASLSLLVPRSTTSGPGPPRRWSGARRPQRRSPIRPGAGTSTAQALSGVFTWLRPNDLVWNYVVNNYLLGKDPPAFDVLFWNQDTVRLAAGCTAISSTSL